MFGLGKPRSKFGKWLDRNDIQQQRLSVLSGVSEDTITRIANNGDYVPSWKTQKRIVHALREYFDSEVSAEDFWD